jgi:hypothetical protein
MGAGECINSFPADQLRVGVPPVLAAFSGAELYFFLARSLLQRLSAAQAEAAAPARRGHCFLLLCLQGRMLAAVSLYTIFCQTDRTWRWSYSHNPAAWQLSVLFCSVVMFVLQSEDLCPHYPMEVKVPFGRKVREKIAHSIRLHHPQDRKAAFERKK